MQTRLKAIFSRSLVRKLVQVSLLLLWCGTRSINIYKVAKSANDNLTQDKHQNNNFFRRRAMIGHCLEEIFMSRDTIIFCLQNLGFVINWKKSVLTPVREIEFLDLKINSVTLELSLNKTKIYKVVSEYQSLLNNPQNQF